MLRGDADRAALALAHSRADGRAVARFERTEPTLADLIERVLADREGFPAGVRACVASSPCFRAAWLTATSYRLATDPLAR
jgi:hypothetical protein